MASKTYSTRLGSRQSMARPCSRVAFHLRIPMSSRRSRGLAESCLGKQSPPSLLSFILGRQLIRGTRGAPLEDLRWDQPPRWRPGLCHWRLAPKPTAQSSGRLHSAESSVSSRPPESFLGAVLSSSARRSIRWACSPERFRMLGCWPPRWPARVSSHLVQAPEILRVLRPTSINAQFGGTRDARSV